MNELEIKNLVSRQRRYFHGHPFPSVQERRNNLKNLYRMVKVHEDEINLALRQDLGKSPAESYMCETGMVLSETRWMIEHLDGLVREKRVPTPLAQYVSRSFKSSTPCGTVLIMSPWNYPIQLTLEPLADALAAGNTVILKPSAYSPAVSAVLDRLLSRTFPKELVALVTGGREENQSLLDQKFDLIFFTGSQQVGKYVLTKAAPHLTPVVLELGGKSPCIVDSSAKIRLAARRIVFGKFLNCGQTCVAPDYLLVQQSILPDLLDAVKKEIVRQFGKNPLENPDYGKIINRKHFDRISGLIDQNVAFGGRTDPERLKIEPTLLCPASFDSPAMGEEIFGPVLPVLTFKSLGEVPLLLQDRQKPLALYMFSENKKNIRYILDRCQFGGGCINDCIIHLATSAMPFGGFGESGMGCYHGREGFETFSHSRSIVDKKTWLDLPMRYQPYTKIHDQLVRLFMH